MGQGKSKILYKAMVLLIAFTGVSGWAQTAFDVVPGGVKPDFYAAKDFRAYVSFRFAGESDWWTSHRVLIRKGEGLTRDGRRAKCGNRFSAKLPPGAKTLPPTLRFLDRLPVLPPEASNLVFPTPDRFFYPPAPPPSMSSESPPETASALPYFGGGLLVPPGGISLRCTKTNHNPKDCKPQHPNPPPAATPEPHTALLVAIGMLLPFFVLPLWMRRKRRSRLWPSPVSQRPCSS